jgi:hypothetical protein
MTGWERAIAAVLVLILPHVCFAGSTGVVINEVLYDPDGRDTGREFVELYNNTSADVCLYYYEVSTGNGAYAGRWKSEWQGARADTIRAGGFFVIGEDAVHPAPDFVTALDLQNGPDACKLISPQSDSDVVGWGALDFAEYYEGTPAADSPSGSSLGREPDGHDTGDNAADFSAFSSPSPGDFNHPPYDLAVVKACLSRYSQADHATVQVISRLANLGTDACGAGAHLHLACRGYRDSSRLETDLEPGATRRIAIGMPGVGEGLHNARVWVEYPPDRWPANDTLLTSVLIWPAPVVINEFIFKPGGGECEWIEVLNRSAALVSLEGWTLEDSGGRRRRIAESGPFVAPGGYLLLVEDEEDFMAVYPGPGCPAVRPAGGWPTLNDTDGRRGYADMVVIRDAFGTCVDSVAYGAAWGKPGCSVERIEPRARSAYASNWSPHYGAGGGSPGRSNSVSITFPEPGGCLKIRPSTFSPDGDGTDDLLSVSVDMPAPAVVRLKVFDINGRPFKTLLDGDLVEERRITFWDGTFKDGRPAPIGIYIVLLEAKPLGGGRTIHSKSAVVLVRR